MKQYPFQVQIVRSSRRTAAIRIADAAGVTVHVPRFMPVRSIESLIDQHMDWIQKHLADARKREEAALPTLTQDQTREMAERARGEIAKRAAFFAPLVGVDYNKITVRCQRTRWGSCSAKGNLSFNCLLMLCPDRVIDYVVVHELCHRLEMNHSPRFWAQVARALPEYASARRWLREEGRLLMDRLPDKNVAESGDKH